jgi:hypothetical protein
MTSIYGITNDQGDVINRIIATPDFVNAAYPGRFVFIEEFVDPAAPVPDIGELINAERDRRIKAGFEFATVLYDFDDRAKANISGAALQAFMAIVAGAQVGNLRWHGGTSDFAWIAADNSIVTMDAQTVIEFGKTAAAHEQGHIFAARTLKDADPVPSDFADDAYWP